MSGSILDRLPDVQTELSRRRGQLQRQIQALSGDLSAATESQALEGTHASHPADAASDILTAEVDLTMLREAHAELREIDEAVERAAAGTYGICVDCGAAIDDERLRAQPLATRCLRCETRAEHLERHEG
jgi:DnaK suppressor protein